MKWQCIYAFSQFSFPRLREKWLYLKKKNTKWKDTKYVDALGFVVFVKMIEAKLLHITHAWSHAFACCWMIVQHFLGQLINKLSVSSFKTDFANVSPSPEHSYSAHTTSWRLPWSSYFPFLPSAVQDYPSLALMSEKMSENNINLVFAVTKYFYPLYKVNKNK